MALPLTAPYFQPSFGLNLLKNYPFLLKLYHKIGAFTAHPLHPFSQGSDLFLAFSGYCPLHSCFRLQFLSILSPYCSVMHAALLSFFFYAFSVLSLNPLSIFSRLAPTIFFKLGTMKGDVNTYRVMKVPCRLMHLVTLFWALFRPEFAQKPTLS